MNKVAVALFLVALPLGAAHAQSMPLATFLAKSEALQKRGAMALFSRDLGVLKAELQNSGKALRADEQAARKAGRAPATCMPPKAGVNSGELLAHFRSIPPAQRGMPVKAAFASLVAKKYPCPGK